MSIFFVVLFSLSISLPFMQCETRGLTLRKAKRIKYRNYLGDGEWIRAVMIGMDLIV